MNDIEGQGIQYKNYVDTHRENVLKAYNFYGNELCSRLDIDNDKLYALVMEHDLSKYQPIEFDGYRAMFYPTEDEEDKANAGYIKAKFDNSWLHHLRNNPHHPEFWTYLDADFKIVCNTMTPIYVAEMILDWASMGIVKNDTAYEYWINNIDAKPFSDETIDIIDSVIDIFKHKIEE